jgi:hypothetical protein
LLSARPGAQKTGARKSRVAPFGMTCAALAIELLHDAIPRLAVQFVEGLFVVAVECVGLLALEPRKILPVPEKGKLADGVIAFAVGPTGLLGGQTFHGAIGGSRALQNCRHQR